MSFPLSSRQSVPVCVALEPVYNALNSFSLLTATAQLSGVNTCVAQTARALTPERRHANRLVFEGLRDALTPEQDVLDFPTYWNNLTGQDPYALRDQVLERLRSRFSHRFSSEESSLAPGPARLLSDMQVYLTCVEYIQVDPPFNPPPPTEVHALLNYAPPMHPLFT